MAALLYFHEISIRGPVFLTKDLLTELDTLLDEAEARANAARDAAILDVLDANFPPDATEERAQADKLLRAKRRSFSDEKDARFVSLTFQNRIWGGRSFAEATKHSSIADETTDQFTVKLEVYELKLEIKPRFPGLYLHTNDSQLYDRLRDWAAKAEPDKWVAVWKKWGGLPFAAVWFPCGILGFLWFYAVATRHTAEQRAAHELLKNGLKLDDQAKAIELILALTSDYHAQAGEAGSPIPSWFLLTIFACSVISGLLNLGPPYVILGIGSGAAKIKSWKTRIGALKWAIVTGLASGIVLPLGRALLFRGP